MSDMQQHMRQQYEEQQAAQNGYTQQPPVSRPAQKPGKDDYIDFEEIK